MTWYIFMFLALDDDGCLTTPLGVNMAEFPLEPNLAKMLLVSGKMMMFYVFLGRIYFE